MTPRFGLSLIVKNGARTLRRALDSFVGVADEIVAVDTGSTDETIAILREYDAIIVEDAWRDDFGAARNIALDHGRSEWFLSLDADEWVSKEDARRLRELTSGDADAYVIDTMNYLTNKDQSTLCTGGDDAKIAPYYNISSKIRLARRSEKLGWEGAVHELLDYSAHRAGYRISHAPITIRHDGFFGKSATSYYEILCRKSYDEGTAHPGIVTTLGVIALSREDAASAEKMFREAIAMDARFDRPVIWLARLLQRLGRSDEAVTLLLGGMKSCPPSAELTCLLVETYLARGDRSSAKVFQEVAKKIFAGSPWLARMNAGTIDA